jgi:hypothetical protein
MAGTPIPGAAGPKGQLKPTCRASSAHGSDQYESETGVAPPPDPRDPHAELAQLTGLLEPPGGDWGSLTRQVERYEQWDRASRAVNGWDAYTGGRSSEAGRSCASTSVAAQTARLGRCRTWPPIRG